MRHGKNGEINMYKQFNNVYKGKTVLVTGHTGFKGSWLTMWLLSLGAKVVGYSSYLPSEPNNFEASKIADHIVDIRGDIRDYESLKKVFLDHKPEIVFHLAAQPIVRRSFEQPKLTFDTNISGSVNVLECIRTTSSVVAAVMITSDKCYKNVEWTWGYRENDTLGGDDPYSASKGAAELVCHSYIASYFGKGVSKSRVCTVRAGNVIGGGDWADDRIIPDCVKAWSKGEILSIRNPEATRPWQHVLEPLSGYLWTGANIYMDEKLSGEAFNFGPDAKVNKSVRELIERLSMYWDKVKSQKDNDAQKNKNKESVLLKLCCDKALHSLGWHSVLSFEDTVKMTAEWYKNYYDKKDVNVYDFSMKQINHYVEEAKKQTLPWVG